MLSPRVVPDSLSRTRVLFLDARLIEATLTAVSHAASLFAAPGLSPPGVASSARQFLPSQGLLRRWKRCRVPPCPGTYGCPAMCPRQRVIPALAFSVPTVGAFACCALGLSASRVGK